MANNGTYGTKKPALITSNDVDIFYFYRPSRSTDSDDFSNGFKKLDSSLLLTTTYEDENENVNNLAGMYNLRLPVDIFGNAGIYTVFIKPREISATILDVGTLAAYPSIRGIVLNTNSIMTEDTSIFNNGGLVGYRVDYYDDENNQLDIYRIITSNNRCEPVAQNFNDAYAKGIKYIFNDSSNLIFCTLTPSTAVSFNANAVPTLGNEGQRVKLVNTKFNPISLEIEMTEHDNEDVITMLQGDQLRNLDKALITTFNNDGEIYHQAEYGNIVNASTGLHADFKITKDSDNVVNTEKDKMDEIKEQL